MTVGTDLADEITMNETSGIVDPVHTPVQIHAAKAMGDGTFEGGADLVDVLAEMVPVSDGKQARAAIVAQYPFSAQWRRGRIESGPLFKYGGETFNTCVTKSQAGPNKPWYYTVFLREHVGTDVRKRRDGTRFTVWTWKYHMSRSFLSVGQAYDLFERLCLAQRNEQELDDPYHTPFMAGPESPWDPHVLTDMAIAQENRDRAADAHASVDWDSVEWTTVNLDGTGAQ